MRLVVAALVARSGGGKESREERGKDTSDLESRDFWPALSEGSKLPPRVGRDTALGLLISPDFPPTGRPDNFPFCQV